MKDTFRKKLQSWGWKMDSWGNMKKIDIAGDEVRIHFKDRVARYEVKKDGRWVRACSGLIRNLDVKDNGKLLGFDR